MILCHIIAINHQPPEIREDYPPLDEYEATMAALMKRYETVFKFRSFESRRDDYDRARS